MKRTLILVVWILSVLLIGILCFMPDYMARTLYTVVFNQNYWHYSHIIQFLAHLFFFAANCLLLLLLLNTSKQINEWRKFMVAFVWVAFLSVISEVGQMYFLPEAFNRSGLNLKDVLANFMGFFLAWLIYFLFKIIYDFSADKPGVS